MTLFEQYQVQSAHAAKLMFEYGSYAASIGCTIRPETIEVHSPEQTALLDAKWKELNK